MSALRGVVLDRRQKDGVANSTINRALEIVRRILYLARDDWGWITRVPAIRMLKEPKRRVRFLKKERRRSRASLKSGCNFGVKKRAGIENFRFHDFRHILYVDKTKGLPKSVNTLVSYSTHSLQIVPDTWFTHRMSYSTHSLQIVPDTWFTHNGIWGEPGCLGMSVNRWMRDYVS